MGGIFVWFKKVVDIEHGIVINEITPNADVT
ncbi:hypothetical protein Nos7524_3596 [Nostoc sp. PCC 7524]|nr:hypothetical protein Nos7524_3596 [Nostoc sp. PCC 7524]